MAETYFASMQTQMLMFDQCNQVYGEACYKHVSILNHFKHELCCSTFTVIDLKEKVAVEDYAIW